MDEYTDIIGRITKCQIYIPDETMTIKRNGYDKHYTNLAEGQTISLLGQLDGLMATILKIDVDTLTVTVLNEIEIEIGKQKEKE